MHFLTNLQIRQFSGAVVSTKGLFMSEPDKGKVGYVLMLFFPLIFINSYHYFCE